MCEHRYMLDSWYNVELYKPEVHAPSKLREILRHWRIGLEEVAHKINTGTYTTLYCLHIIWHFFPGELPSTAGDTQGEPHTRTGMKS